MRYRKNWQDKLRTVTPVLNFNAMKPATPDTGMFTFSSKTSVYTTQKPQSPPGKFIKVIIS